MVINHLLTGMILQVVEGHLTFDFGSRFHHPKKVTSCQEETHRTHFECWLSRIGMVAGLWLRSWRYILAPGLRQLRDPNPNLHLP